jgi:glutathione synthase/RimK-type ligase-like ATP-grasp enzyme
MKTILIASSSIDGPTLQPVIDRLEDKGFRVVWYKADDVAAGRKTLTYGLDNRGIVRAWYDGERFDPEDIAAAWYRRPNEFRVFEDDRAKVLSLDRERRESQESLWRAIPAERWLNAPHIMHAADDKILQLREAKHLGFEIPSTVISNKWDAIFESLPEDEVVLKMNYGWMLVNNRHKLLTTTLIKRSQREALAKISPFPGHWQGFIPKKREWRVTVVGDKVFPASIHTTEKSRVDWRNHQADPKLVQFKEEVFPKEYQQKCVAMLKRFNINYGAFDFIETPDGRMVFLEVNTNGQYQWLVDALHLPIPEAIADKLAALANK